MNDGTSTSWGDWFSNITQSTLGQVASSWADATSSRQLASPAPPAPPPAASGASVAARAAFNNPLTWLVLGLAGFALYKSARG